MILHFFTAKTGFLNISIVSLVRRNTKVYSFTDETENFIQRWGTHFIKSAKFGGELEIRKTMDAKQAGTKSQFSSSFALGKLFASRNR